jgi:predicted transcriptional regulator of viral defense system
VAYIAFPGLSERELSLWLDWERTSVRLVQVSDLKLLVGQSAYSTASRLVKKGVLMPLGAGAYAVRPLRFVGRPWTQSAAVTVEALLSDTPHYVGGLSAVTAHRLSEQVYVSRLDVFVPTSLRPRRLGDARVHFHKVRLKAFQLGLTSVRFEGVEVTYSDPERTLLDALDYPALFGGLQQAENLVRLSLPKVDPSKLVHYAIELSSSSTCQRLGLLLERSNSPGRVWRPLMKKVQASESLPSMLTNRARKGKVNTRWRIVENDLAA